MKEQTIIAMQRQLNTQKIMLEAVMSQIKQLEQYIGVTMETMKRMNGFQEANLQLQKDLNDSKNDKV
jgi:hypothetical protein